jgi:hypothetical protein
MLFEELTDSEKSELLEMSKKIVLDGKLPPQTNPFVSLWMKTLNIEDRNWLVMASVAFPQRALLSLIK